MKPAPDDWTSARLSYSTSKTEAAEKTILSLGNLSFRHIQRQPFSEVAQQD
jgi:hypothetical protein